MDLATDRAALIVAHPGHELRVHGWLEQAKPAVFVLTDGSGRTARSRIESTIKVLAATGAKPADIFGRFTDVAVYKMIRGADVVPLLHLMRELANWLRQLGVDYVVGDALEGFNPSHDLCRFLINGAVSLIEKETGREIGNFDVLLDGSPEVCPRALRPLAIRLDLDERALRRKLASANAYSELSGETDSALKRFGPQAFSTELLRPVLDRRQGLDRMEPDPPDYERFGEERVRAGLYDNVIRYRADVRPLVNALWHGAGLVATDDAPTSMSAPPMSCGERLQGA